MAGASGSVNTGELGSLRVGARQAPDGHSAAFGNGDNRTHLNLSLRVEPTVPEKDPRQASSLLEAPGADGISAFSLPSSSEFASAA